MFFEFFEVRVTRVPSASQKPAVLCCLTLCIRQLSYEPYCYFFAWSRLRRDYSIAGEDAEKYPGYFGGLSTGFYFIE